MHTLDRGEPYNQFAVVPVRLLQPCRPLARRTGSPGAVAPPSPRCRPSFSSDSDRYVEAVRVPGRKRLLPLEMALPFHALMKGIYAEHGAAVSRIMMSGGAKPRDFRSKGLNQLSTARNGRAHLHRRGRGHRHYRACHGGHHRGHRRACSHCSSDCCRARSCHEGHVLRPAG